MSKYTIAKHEVIYRVYEVNADSEKEAIDKVENSESDIKELVGQGSYDCDIEWDARGYLVEVDEEEYNRYKASRNK
jgi:hypothetical protein